MKALIDADVLRYEIGACVEGDDGPLPFDVAAEYLDAAVERIATAVEADSVCMYLTDGGNFRNEIAVTKPYKGNRKSEKPFHFANLTTYIKNQYEWKSVDGLEADDLMAIDQLDSEDLLDTVICTRDKDLRMIPGWHYGWECGKQPEMFKKWVTYDGKLWKTEKGKVCGEGMSFFYLQLLVGDTVDNIPGCPGIGDSKAWKILGDLEPHEMYDAVLATYKDRGADETLLLEQGQLLWMTRELTEKGEPVLWQLPN
jgi:hypothetical protein